MKFKLTKTTWFVFLLVVTVGLALLLPPDPQALKQFHSSAAQYRLAIAVLLVPYIFIWYASYYAFAKLQEYTHSFKGPERSGFKRIKAGMGVLAYGLIVGTAISLILNFIAVHHQGFKTPVLIINNYFNMLLPLVTFLLMGFGSRALLSSIKTRIKNYDLRIYGLGFVILSALFAYLAVTNQAAHNAYHMNVYVLIITLIAPYMYVWLLGMLSSYELLLYAKYVKGVLYQQAVRRFAQGIAVVIIADVAIQFVTTTLIPRYENSLGAILLIDYILLFVLIAGLVLMARGTKQLNKIEVV